MDLSASKELQQFIKKVIEPSIEDIDKMEEASRKHIQKLVYTNLVDRFDSTIDHLFLDNVRHDNLLPEALKNSEEPMTKKELFELLLKGNDLDAVLDEKLRDGISNNITRNNHAQKLRDLLRLCAETANAHGQHPRVNISTGEIKEKITPQKNSNQPYSIVGYADWLYARRNSIVHGSGTSKFLDRDTFRIKKVHKVTIAKTFKISLGSIRLTKAFYSDVLELIETHATG